MISNANTSSRFGLWRILKTEFPRFNLTCLKLLQEETKKKKKLMIKLKSDKVKPLTKKEYGTALSTVGRNKCHLRKNHSKSFSLSTSIFIIILFFMSYVYLLNTFLTTESETSSFFVQVSI